MVDVEENDSGAQEQTGKGLRAQLESALAEQKALKDQLAEFQARERKAEVAKHLEGYDPRVANFVPADADVAEWLKENGEVFRKADAPAPPTEGEAAATTAPAVEQTAQVDPAIAQGFNAAAQVEQGAGNPARETTAAERGLLNVKGGPEAIAEYMQSLRRSGPAIQ